MMRKSLSLVEITTVLTIIAWVTGVALFSVNYIIPKRIESAGRKVVSTLVWLRQFALAQDEDMIARFRQNNRTIELYRGSVAAGNLIDTVLIQFPLTTTPADDPLDLTFYALDRTDGARRGIADADTSDAALDDLLVTIEGEQKVQVIGETGYARYLK